MISQTAAAKILNVSQAYIAKLKKAIPQPGYFVVIDGKHRIDENHPEFLSLIEKNKYEINKKENNKRVSEAKKKQRKKNNNDSPSGEYDDPETLKLRKKALIAQMQDTIYAAEIKKEKALQERIKTAELKKDLAPISLLKHFFSFSENLIQRLYRRPHEISPQIEALYIAGESKKAIDMFRREIESIVKQTQQELIKEIESEGYGKKL